MVSWHDWFLAEYEHIERIVVFRQRLRNEAVVRWIINCGIQDAIELDQAAGFIEFILDARSERDLDHAIEFLRELVAGCYVVPGMNHKGCRADVILAEGGSQFLFQNLDSGIEED